MCYKGWRLGYEAENRGAQVKSENGEQICGGAEEQGSRGVMEGEIEDGTSVERRAERRENGE